MSDDSGYPPEAPLIDARSPAERWAEAGRTGAARLRERIEHGRLDTAGVWWMGLLLLYTALQMYTALRADDLVVDVWWTRAALLASSGGFFLIFGALTGVALAGFFHTSAARLTLRLALVAGTWSVLAGLLGVAVSFHSGISLQFATTPGGEGKFVSALGNLCYSGLGAVVAALAWQLLTTWASRPSDGIRAATL